MHSPQSANPKVRRTESLSDFSVRKIPIVARLPRSLFEVRQINQRRHELLTLADTYAMSLNGATLPVTQTGIAWKSDRDDKFGHYQAQNFNTDPALRGGAAIGGAGINTTFVRNTFFFVATPMQLCCLMLLLEMRICSSNPYGFPCYWTASTERCAHWGFSKRLYCLQRKAMPLLHV